MKYLPRFLISTGIFLIIASFLILGIIFIPVAKEEVNYAVNKPNLNKEIVPKDKSFGIVIPKIGANSAVVPNVDPYNSKIYQYALTKGVAHAKGTSYPGEKGNIFLFSHSSANLLEASRFNSVFYLIDKLGKDDKIYIYYKNKKYEYRVTDKKIVDAKDISYLNPGLNTDNLILMTCWPAGTNYKRLLVFATL